MNIKAVYSALDHLHRVTVSTTVGDNTTNIEHPIPDPAPAFTRNVLGKMMARQGEDIPVSALPCDGTYPSGTAKWETATLLKKYLYGTQISVFNEVNVS